MCGLVDDEFGLEIELVVFSKLDLHPDEFLYHFMGT